MRPASFGKRPVPGAERLCRAVRRRGGGGPPGREAGGPLGRQRMGRTGAGRGRRRPAGGHELLREVESVSARTVTSLTNPTVKAVRALHMRKERDETGLFVAE